MSWLCNRLRHHPRAERYKNCIILVLLYIKVFPVDHFIHGVILFCARTQCFSKSDIPDHFQALLQKFPQKNSQMVNVKAPPVSDDWFKMSPLRIDAKLPQEVLLLPQETQIKQ